MKHSRKLKEEPIWVKGIRIVEKSINKGCSFELEVTWHDEQADKYDVSNGWSVLGIKNTMQSKAKHYATMIRQEPK
ncbi:predicted protein [Sclerotinia sclerotiorum 1980 UF-70]|uniref:Uncharacterized protein n=1 Tax=Sclerotinia sclerotiorum (strain ATCC 18683 / 1980 / Ss-1) TaxID=665079 RepID=A7EF27_SCLS1|nr:predicted protein [Sclerotinia sclerotiorum 1980 UF-70]EDO01443.1 predicted protein [Sclerotinia sclerotiorum 1980 UF-70]